ncbi:MAG: MaoC family dehydratase [Chloroflexi bacterium]|nr:MaoC family dehydratase [Chloroflexota bacterium]
MTARAIDQVQVGAATRFHKTVTGEDIRKYAEVSGDFNPLHLDEVFARKTVFGDRIAHGMLTLGFVSAALAKLPGTVVYLSQSVKFLRPVKIRDTIEAVAEVVERVPDKGQVVLKTTCSNQRGELVLEGEARVKLFDLP